MKRKNTGRQQKTIVDSDLDLEAQRRKMRFTGEGRECLEDITGLRRRLCLTLRSISEHMKIVKSRHS
ncbi:hypothetical protein N7447_008468 [Penicillium robsamsonii]|uniref:uncharacterized protein n=1 Tax=Penicillium robsamsonii TaxID=1792511 RepID=UPI0025496BC1|nr:uncharacterized protein N7447_008468 [Penicillium robsamsonii]KAJ5816235.1 hypothetical protein N7447_008468 [Penicillium robsamsonii]